MASLLGEKQHAVTRVELAACVVERVERELDATMLAARELPSLADVAELLASAVYTHAGELGVKPDGDEELSTGLDVVECTPLVRAHAAERGCRTQGAP
jgi:hypothetical protein